MLFGEQMLLLAAQNENSLSRLRLRLLLKKQNQKKENKTVFGAGRKEKAKHLFQLEQLNEIFERV